MVRFRDPLTAPPPRIVLFALGLVLGIGLARLLGLPGVAPFFAFSLLWIRRGFEDRDPASPRLAGGLGFALGLLLPLPPAAGPAPGTEGSPLPREGPVRFEGRLLAWRGPDRFGAYEGLCRIRGRAFPLRVRPLGTRGTSAPDLGPGRRISGLAFLRDRGRGGVGLETRMPLLRGEAGSFGPAALRRRLREVLGAPFRRIRDPGARALCLRLVLGEEGRLPAEDRRNHRRLGLGHFLAVSGLHAVFLAALLTRLLRFLPAPRFRLLLLALLLGTWAWLTGGRPPVLRAVLAWCSWQAAKTHGLRPPPLAVLSFAAIPTLLLDPGELTGPGFLLSYLAVAGLVWLRPLLEAPFAERFPRFVLPLRPFLASASAWLPLCGPSWFFFGSLSPWSIPLSPVAAPLVFCTMTASFLLPLCRLLPSWIFEACLAVCEGAARLHLDLCASLSGLPGAPLFPAGPLPETLLALVLLSGSAAALVLASPRIFLAVSLTGLGLGFLPWEVREAAACRILRVGHGQCVLVLAGKRTLVYDCGDLRGGERAAQRCLEALREEGRAGIDDFVLSHGDLDHAGGLPFLAARTRISRLWLPDSPDGRLWASRLRGRVGRVLFPPRGRISRIGTGIEILHPGLAPRVSGNDAGLSLRIELPRKGPRLLFCGDLQEAGIAALLQVLGKETSRPPLDFLLLPHHGEPSLARGELLAALRPAAALVSASAAQSLRARRRGLWPATLPVFSTGECGTLVLRERKGAYFFGCDEGFPLASFSSASPLRTFSFSSSR